MGYIQGMSYLAAMLCLHIEDTYLVVQCLANLMVSEHLFDFYQVWPPPPWGVVVVQQLASPCRGLGGGCAG